MRRGPDGWPGWRTTTAYAKAHGVTLRGAAGYMAVWMIIALASRFGVSALGLELAEPGSTPMDTIAVLLMLIPATILGRCLTSRVPHWEVTRSRATQPTRLIWSAVVGLAAVAAPLLTMPLLHQSIDRMMFLADWFLIFGVQLVLGTVFAGSVTMVGVFATLAMFTTPGLLPWEANIVYNVDVREASTAIGATLAAFGLLLLGVRGQRVAAMENFTATPDRGS